MKTSEQKTKVELQRAEAAKFDEICEFLARRCGYESDPDKISGERRQAVVDEAEKLLISWVWVAPGDKNLEPKYELQRLLIEYHEIGRRTLGLSPETCREKALRRKRIEAVRKRLVRLGVLVNSGERRRGQVVWIPNPELTEEQRQALINSRLESLLGEAIMTKTEIVADIEALISARLFGAGPWLADRETAGLLIRRIQQMGLAEPAPGEAGGWQNTALGNELDVDLLEVFLGVWDEWGVPEILEAHGFIDWSQVKHLIDMMDAGGDPEKILKPYAIDAYRRRHGNS